MVLFSLCKLAAGNLPPLSIHLGRHLSWIKHELLPSDEECDAKYLASASDRHELEFRIRELDKSGRQRRGPFRRF
ncbi:DUF3563 family protein [Microvirga zambiensis]|uniref:DUF3563 family protein n=1 Tax=Microvirga zambiensis TaxID=1402137 RepID=UPI00191CCDF6|nr:DUF3563 family protein [Microvirga zambiensis]